MIVHYQFDSAISGPDQARIKAAMIKAVESGEILTCQCPTGEAWIYETRPPDFQASISCACDAMRPTYSSTPDTD